jgi:asparagine synthase (glutamine-hydrolysing)
MCGIAGILSKSEQPVFKRELEAMAREIAHRGPDGQGIWQDRRVGLAHRRLAIIDLSTEANQPMLSAEGDLALVFNGEIYNFRELREQLEAKGFTFRTRSDTEVILAAWRAWGTDAIARLDGMFAIALWDQTNQQLLLARDRTGKKPLYVYEDAEKLLFASEIKSILTWPGVDRRMNPEAIPQFLSHGYVPTPGTFYARIRKLEPATWEVHTPGQRFQRCRYWDFPVGPERQVRDVREIEERLSELFFAAVKRRLVADVPLGAFLSGGVDSSLVVAAMAKLTGKPIKTFSIGFEGHPEWDETPWAAKVARQYATDHTEFKVRPESFDLLDKLAWHYDEPFGDSSAIPTYIVSKLTREKVTVALTGDGGDELFAGYPRFAGAVASERIPRPLRVLGGRILQQLPHGLEHNSFRERARRFGVQAARNLPDRLRGWISMFAHEELERLLRPELMRYGSEALIAERYYSKFRLAAAADTLNQVLYVNASTYLLDDLNVKMDRASMAVGLEARSPFLDTALMDFVFTLPGSLKLRGLKTKAILKQALGHLLPPEILTRKKMGFGVPLGAWFRGSLRELLTSRLLDTGSPLHEYLRPETLAALVDQHLSGRRDLAHQFWCLLMLERWLRRERGAAARVAA